MLSLLGNIPFATDLFVSSDTEAKQVLIQTLFAGWDKGSIEVRVMPNRGRDIAPKLVGFRDVHDRYSHVLHLHSKVSKHADFLSPWRTYLYQTLLGSPSIVRSVFDAFARLPDLGMVVPQHFEPVRRWLGWHGNFAQARALAARMGLTLDPARALDFPSGSMFWAKSAALRPLLDLNLSFEDFPVEGEQTDHTLAHVIERLFLYACERSGHDWLKIADPALHIEPRTIIRVGTLEALVQFQAEHGIRLSGANPPAPRAEAPPMMTEVPPGLKRRLRGSAPDDRGRDDRFTDRTADRASLR
jgi:lipopolysaccharide biosynthesis protein